MKTSKIKKPATDNNTQGTDHKSALAKNKQLEEQLKRALADYQNLERRVEEERRLVGQLSSAILVERFLPVLDNLETAQSHLKDQGLEMVLKQFRDVLTQEGVSEIPSVGSHFDPHFHEATEVIQGEKDNLVVKVIKKGYKINDKVIRPAQVVVSRQKVDETTEEKAEKASEFGDYA